MRASTSSVTTSQPTAQGSVVSQRHAGEGAGAARIVGGVDQHDIDDDEEAQRRHRDEIAGEPHQRRADDEGEHDADQAGDDRRRQEGQAEGQPSQCRQIRQIGCLGRERQRQDAGDIGADADEADMAEREHAGEAVGRAPMETTSMALMHMTISMRTK